MKNMFINVSWIYKYLFENIFKLVVPFHLKKFSINWLISFCFDLIFLTRSSLFQNLRHETGLLTLWPQATVKSYSVDLDDPDIFLSSTYIDSLLHCD